VNFLVTANRPRDAVEVCQRAVKFYEKLAVERPTVTFTEHRGILTGTSWPIC